MRDQTKKRRIVVVVDFRFRRRKETGAEDAANKIIRYVTEVLSKLSHIDVEDVRIECRDEERE